MTRGVRRGREPRRIVATGALLVAIAVVAVAAAVASAEPGLRVGPPGGIVYAHGQGHKPSSKANLTYHGGSVLTSGADVTPIFWGSSWGTSAGDKITGIESFYAGIGGTSYAGTNTEYTDASGHVGTSVTSNAAIVDLSAAPSRAPSTSDIRDEVSKLISNPVPNGYYPVYIDAPRRHASYCAWHSYGTVNGTVVQFAFFFNLDGDAGCDPQSNGAGSQGLKALANVSGHELSETLTDPNLDAWYDSSQMENADKCAWTFGKSRLQFKNGTSWKIQGNWSNQAYSNGTGYIDSSSGNVVTGCIDGTN